MRLAFFGTPDIARTMLEGLIAADDDDIVLVICQPDKPRGRGKKLEFPPVKQAALEAGLEVVQPRKLKDGVLAERLRSLKVDVGIVVAYGRILPLDVFQAPEFDTLNVHASLLPRHRGASPIQHTVLHGDAEGGVTLMMLSEGMDEGDMLYVHGAPLNGTETGGSLFEQTAQWGRQALIQGLRQAKTDGLTRQPQVDGDATYAPKLSKQRGALDFTRPALELERQIRAFNPWPGSYVPGAEGPLKIHDVRLSGLEGAPGAVLNLNPLIVAAGRGALILERLQPPGKKAMAAADYLRGAGRQLKIGDHFAAPLKPPET